MSEYVFGIDGYITADVNADEWLDAFLEWMESRGWQFGGITGETEHVALKMEIKRLRDGMRDVRDNIAPIHTAHDMITFLTAEGDNPYRPKEQDDE